MCAAPALYVHLGLPKTGTSYLQSICDHSEAALAAQGLTLLPRPGTTAFQVMLDVREELRPELDAPEAFGALDRLAQQVRELTTPRALLSQELFCLASAEQAGRLVGALDAEVHVVVTVRDLATQLPSLWQQHVKARGVTPYEGFLDRVTSEDTGQARGYDVLAVLAQWREHVPPERTHIVAVPPRGAGPEDLLARFCGVIGVDPGSLDTDHVEGNPSLGMVQAELLRRVNLALGDRLPHARAGYRGPGKRFLAETILIQQEGAPPRLPERARPWVEERSRQVVESLGSGGYDVVGDLSELLPGDAAPVEATPVSDAELLDAATEALAAILAERAEDRGRLRRQIRRQRQRIAELEAGLREGGLLRRLRR